MGAEKGRDDHFWLRLTQLNYKGPTSYRRKRRNKWKTVKREKGEEAKKKENEKEGDEMEEKRGREEKRAPAPIHISGFATVVPWSGR